MPRLASLLGEALRSRSCEVAILPWGGRRRQRRVAARAAGYLRDLGRLRAAVARERPEILLVQTSHEAQSVARDLLLACALRRSGVRLVLEFHGGHANRLTQPGRRLLKTATGLLLDLTDGVLVLSSEERELLQAFRPEGSFHQIVNPFQPPDRQAAANGNGRGHGDPVLLFASRLVPEKGLFDTAEAFALLARRRPCRLVVAGDGPAAVELHRWVRASGLRERVTLAGRLSPERLWDEYNAADVFVLPTYHPEGFPTALSEAMSSGLPIVTSRVRGIADHLDEGRNALFVPPHDPQAIAAAVERLLESTSLRERMAGANRAKAASFAPEAVVDGYLAAFQQIVGG